MYVDREYTAEIECQRKLLRPILRLAHTIEKYQGKCKIEVDHLVILGIKYSVNDIHKLPNDLSGFHASSKSSNKTHAFFGELSPFSNFHGSNFELNGVSYFCGEQMIQSKKALLFNDTASAERIMLSESAMECKILGKTIKGYKEDIWKKEAEKLYLPRIIAKFNDNPALSDMLLSTGDQMIVEATYDTMWGTGIPLHQSDCLDSKKWKGTGLLGELLMTTRRKLQNRNTLMESCIQADTT